MFYISTTIHRILKEYGIGPSSTEKMVETSLTNETRGFYEFQDRYIVCTILSANFIKIGHVEISSQRLSNTKSG